MLFRSVFCKVNIMFLQNIESFYLPSFEIVSKAKAASHKSLEPQWFEGFVLYGFPLSFPYYAISLI